MPRREAARKLTKPQLMIRRSDVSVLFCLLERMLEDAGAVARLARALDPAWTSLLRKQREGWKSLLELAGKTIREYGIQIDMLERQARIRARQGKAYTDDPQAV